MYYQVSSAEFISQFAKMREDYPVIRDNTSTPTEIHKAAKFHDSYYLHHDRRSGFIITESGELKGVFSIVKGRGDILVETAVKRGATHLDCFDGYLVKLYQRHGFGSWKIEPNWTPGGPAVHYMKLGNREEQEEWLHAMSVAALHDSPETLDEAHNMLRGIYRE